MKRSLSGYKPTKMWIDGHCFEIPKFNKDRKPKKSNKKNEAPPEENSKSEVRYPINTHDDGKLSTTFRLPLPYYAKLSNHPHWNREHLENNTKTSICIPIFGHESVIISGEDEDNIIRAREEIHSVIGAIRDGYMAMQFISIPTMSEEIIENFRRFKEIVLNEDGVDGVEDSIFQKHEKLHLTIAVFSLLDDREKDEASKALAEYTETILHPLIKENGPLKIHISGIDTMNNNLRKTDVLYAKAKIMEENEDLSLQKIVNDIKDHFYHRGLMRKYEDNVKLHMTLMNTKYRKTPDSPKRRRWGNKISFNAQPIIDKYKDFHFGTCCLDSIHLSLISTTGEDGFYKPILVVTLDPDC